MVAHRRKASSSSVRPIFLPLLVLAVAPSLVRRSHSRAGLGFASAQHADAGANVLFTFQRSQCLAGSIRDSSGGGGGGGPGLLGPLLVAAPDESCLPTGDGVRGFAGSLEGDAAGGGQLASNATVGHWSALVQQSQAFSLELWLRPPTVLPAQGTFLVASMDYPGSADSAPASGKPELGAVVEDGKLLRVFMGDGQSFCSLEYDLANAPAESMLHAVTRCEVFDPSATSSGFVCVLYVNGQVASDVIGGCQLALPGTSRLFLYSVPSGMRMTASHVPWAGNVHVLALYDRALSSAEIKDRYNARVPNNRPVAADATLSVQKNGVVGSHYATPEYYVVPVPALELPTLPLRALDADEDPGSPNYNGSAPLHWIVLASLPSKGALYFLNGTAISATPMPVPRIAPLPGDDYTSPTAYVRYCPLWNETSAPETYTSFTFMAVDGVTGLASDPATVSVVVTPTHSIPAAANITVRTLAGVPIVVGLNGSAYDGAAIVNASITALPATGSLYQVHPFNGSIAFSSGPIALPSAGGRAALWGPAVAYTYTGAQDLPLAADGTLATDAFGFAVHDDRNATSVGAPVIVAVGTPLSAGSPPPQPGGGLQNASTVLEHEVSPVTLVGTDATQLDAGSGSLELCFEITGLPRHGALYELTGPESAVPIEQAGAMVRGQQQVEASENARLATATVLYKSGPSFFNVPHTAWDGGSFAGQDDDADDGVEADEEAFAYRVVSCLDDAVGSLPVTQPLLVRNVNERTVLSLDATEYSVYPTFDPDNSTASGPRPTQVRLAGVAVMDPDRGADPVLVKVACQYGMLAIDPAAAQLVDFNSSRFCPTSCLKRTSKLLVFVTSPAALEGVLGGLSYTTTLAGAEDTIMVTVLDGVGSPCLAVGAVPTLSDVSTGCFVEEATLHVASQNFAVVDEAEAKHQRRGRSALPFILAGLASGILATISICGYLCCCRSASAGVCAVHPVAAAALPASLTTACV